MYNSVMHHVHTIVGNVKNFGFSLILDVIQQQQQQHLCHQHFFKIFFKVSVHFEDM